MSWLYSQALVEEYLGDISLDGAQSVPLNGNPTQQAYCAPDKMTVFSRLSRFGMTFKPLTESRGEDLLTLYREDFLAKTSQQQATAQELMESEAECGEKWRGSFTKYDPDMSLWRTHQCSLLGDLEPFSETWPQWGLMRNGECWEQQTLAHPTKETVFGFYVPTPTSSDGTSGAVIGKNDQFYPTKDGKPRKINQKGNDGAIGLGRLVLMWPTPTASQARSEGMILQMRKMVEIGTTTLEEAEAMIGGSLTPKRMENWPTPVKSDYAARRPSKGWQGKSDLPSVVWTETGGRENPTMSPAQLNATWVEWLMGWPLGWTDLKPLETDKSHCVPQQHGKYSVKEFND